MKKNVPGGKNRLPRGVGLEIIKERAIFVFGYGSEAGRCDPPGERGNPVQVRDSTCCCKSFEGLSHSWPLIVASGRRGKRDESEDLP